MEIYKIEIQETLARVIEMEGNSIQDAISKVSELYKESDIVLDYNDFIEVNFIDTNSQSVEDERNILMKEVIDYLFEVEEKHYEEYMIEPTDHIYLKLKRLKDLIA